jgi:hypothetical protein
MELELENKDAMSAVISTCRISHSEYSVDFVLFEAFGGFGADSKWKAEMYLIVLVM